MVVFFYNAEHLFIFISLRNMSYYGMRKVWRTITVGSTAVTYKSTLTGLSRWLFTRKHEYCSSVQFFFVLYLLLYYSQWGLPVRPVHLCCSPFQIVHNYGHGGSGITLFGGCALDVTSLVEQKLTEIHPSHKLWACHLEYITVAFYMYFQFVQLFWQMNFIKAMKFINLDLSGDFREAEKAR